MKTWGRAESTGRRNCDCPPPDHRQTGGFAEFIGQNDLTELARQIREFLVTLAAEKGGHFASSLGVVELDSRPPFRFQHPRGSVDPGM